MKFIFINIKYCILFFQILISFIVTAQRQTENGFRSKFGPDYLVGYLAYTPLNYNLNPSKNYPVMIFLHGAGEKAFKPSDLSNLYKVKKNGPPMLIEHGQDFPFIVISPQCPFGDWDQVTTDDYETSEVKPGELVNEILETVKKLYRIDTNRVYITGLSAGGAGAWSFAQNYPAKVAAVMPIAGWGDFNKVCSLAANNVAVWAFQGELDNGVAIQNLVNEVNICNPAPKPLAKATIYTGVDHDAWTQTYTNDGPGIAPDNIYDWFMRQSKVTSSVITNIKVSDDNYRESSVSVFPVPVQNMLSIIFYAEKRDRIVIKFYNQTGVEVLQHTFGTEQSKNVFSIDVSGIENGNFVVTISDLRHFFQQKVLIAR